jgi:hypothetical protein
MCNWQRALESPETNTTIMDTMTYAALGALSWSVAQINNYPIIPEAEFHSLNWSYIGPIGPPKSISLF